MTVFSENTTLDPGMPFGFIVSGVSNLPSFAPLENPFTITTRSNDEEVGYATGSLIPDFANTIPSELDLNATFYGGTYG